MKKILHLFCDPSHSALWSRYLRMLTLIALFAFGSHGVWGLGIKRNVSMTNISLPTTDSKGTFENKVYTWSDGSNNLIQFKDLDNSDLSEYEKIVVPVSNWSIGVLRCVIRVKNEGGGTTDYTCALYDRTSPSKELELGSFKNNVGTKITKNQLKNVESVFFGGADANGSATIGQIYLTKQLDWDENGQITILPQDINCDGRVTKNGTNFKFAGQFATVTIDFIGDGISAKKLASASSSPTHDGFSIFYSNNDYDKLSTSELDDSNVIRVKYAYQKEQPANVDVTIDKFVLEYKDPITVTLNADPGTIDGKSSKTIKYCETPITLPAATPNATTQVFNAWRYIDNNGNGSHVGNAGDKYTPTGNITLTAHYTNKTLYYNNELGNCLGDYTKTVPTNTVFTDKYTINKDTQKEFTFKCNRPQSEALNAFWYGWILWAKPSSATGNVNDKPFYFWTNAQDTRFATDANTGIWDKSISSDIKISRDGKLYDMTPDERNTYLSDMGNSAQVTVKVAYFDNTIRMYAVMKSRDGARTYVQAYEYKDKGAYINNATSIDVYFSVDHAYLTNFIYDKAVVDLVTATGLKDTESTGNGTVNIYTTEGYDIHNPAKVGKGESVVFEAIPDAGCKFTKWGGSGYTDNPRTVPMTENKFPSATFVKALETITVDKNIREYGIYVPEGAKNAENGTIPVIISLHGRDGKVDPDNGENPNFNSIAKTNNIIVVYPQGRNAADADKYTGFETGWNNGFAGTTGWEATGKENGDTRFIEELVKEIKTKYPQANPKRFYLCGFSMGGMMTYACAKVLNGTFAAYGSCGGYPLNEFHLNLATKQPVPFIHLHGNSDNFVGINHLHTIIENLLFRNGCNLADHKTTNDWKSDTYNGNTYNYKRYDFTGVNGVPVTTVTFKNLGHTVAPSAPDYLWNFFKDKKLGTYTTTTMKWQWDMTTINSNLGDSDGYPYGWKRVQIAGNNNGTLTYGDNRKTDANQNVYNSIQLEKGTYKLHAKANVVSSDETGIIVGIYKVGATENNGKCIVRRQVKNNSGNASDNLSILYPFTVTEDGEYYVKIERGNAESSCTALAIHTSDYNPDDEDDSENAMNLPTDWKNTGLIVKIDFEESNVGANCENIDEETTSIKEGKDQNKNDYIHFTGTVPNEGYKLYNCHKGDNKQKWAIKDVILHDAVFGNYFQNIPKAQFYDRSGNMNYMRAVLKDKALSPIKTSGEATIGFWVNGRVAVDAGLSYNDASMLYLSGPWRKSTSVNGEAADRREYQSMFNIRCNGNTNGFLNSKTGKQIRYYANDMFGDLCDNETTEKYYKKNLYLDRNWHYVTMVMYNGLRNVDMYVDGELTNSRQNIVGGDQDLTAGLDSINHIIIGGLNATYTTFGYDPAFAFDDIVIYSRALSSQEINQIITDKEYSPNSWDFEKNIANTALLNEEKLNATGSLWTYNSDTQVYTLKKKLSNEAELTYDGIRVIPAFRGLKFVTGAEGQIQIDMAKKRLKVIGYSGSDGKPAQNPTVMKISNAPAGQYLRYEYDDIQNVWLNEWINQPFKGDFSISNSKTVITNVSGSGRQTCTCNVNGTISFKSIGSTDKVYADLCFGTSTGNTNINRVSKVDFSSDDLKDKTVTEYTDYPNLLLIENGTGYNGNINFQNLTADKYSGKIKFWSSAPHVAYITGVTGNQPTVKATGVPGSAYIYAELENNNEYDCNNENAGLYESSSRIIARYEIHVPNKETGYSVKISNDKNHDNNPFNVGDVLKTTDNAVTLTLGGWNYNNNHTYFSKYTDGYTKKEQWKGMPLKKTKNDTNGYSSEYDTSSGAATTDGDTYSALSSYTGGTHAASSEQMDGNPNTGLFSTTVINNSTPWTLPCRGSYAKIEPTEAGIISVYVLQEGCMERNLTGETKTCSDRNSNSYNIAPNEPYDISIKKVYVADEAGQVIEDVVTDTKSKIVSQVWKDDGRARAEYSYYVENTAYSQLLHAQFKQNIVDVSGDNYAVTLLDKWNSPGMTQNIIKFGKGFGIVDKGIVRYTFNVLPGKTYYVFSNDAKIGIAGFNFTKDKQLNFDSKHEIIADNPLAGDLTPTESVTLVDTQDYFALTKKNATVTLNRTFYKNYWNAICLPYSINRRQIEDVFGDGTMVVLMNNINTSTKKVMFIEHANQDIIAGYPYLIFPTDKTDNDKTNHDPIRGGIITTRATFGEANSPLFTVGTDGTTYTDGKMQPNALVFKGTFSKADLPVGSYVITKSGTLANVPQKGLKINPYRAYIHFNQTTHGAKAIKLASMGFAGFDDMEGETTSIEDLLFNDGIMTRPADVFNVNGQKVRSKAENLYGLPKGVYIVNGKKYVNK